MRSPRLRLGAFSTVMALLLVAAPAAAAPDPKAVADALVAAAVAAGGTASYASAEAAGEDVVVTDFKATQRGQTLTVPSLVIAAPAPREPGGFTSPRVTFDNVSGASSEGPSMSWQTGLAEDVILSTPEEIKTRASVRPFRSVRVAGIQIAVSDGGSPVTIDEVASEFGEVAAGQPRSFSMRAGPIAFKTDLLARMPTYRRVVELLGYKDFVVNVASEGGYDDKSDTLALSSFTVDTADVGKVTVSGKFSGMSLGRIATKSDSVGTTAQAKLDNLQTSFRQWRRRRARHRHAGRIRADRRARRSSNRRPPSFPSLSCSRATPDLPRRSRPRSALFSPTRRR